MRREEGERVDPNQALHEVRARWPKIARLADSLRQLREENHFAELIEEGLWGRKKGT